MRLDARDGSCKVKMDLHDEVSVPKPETLSRQDIPDG
jgi:hypothetical protein